MRRLVPLAAKWRHAVAATSMLAAALSALYVHFFLRGGPRIIDATAYWFQSRVLASGHLSLAVAGPPSSHRGRFLVEVEPGHFAGIFPPGYPALLALFQRAGAPLLSGPCLALALTASTAWLAGELCAAQSVDEKRAQTARILAALFSMASWTLRYHTADTMAHGATMLAVTLALGCALSARRLDAGARASRASWRWAAAGAALGYVGITRFASALALGPVLFWLAMAGRHRGRASSLLMAGALPFPLLLLAYQRALTGSLWTSLQSRYYLLADAPAGCFRYGFGQGAGCMFEHGDFVRHNLPDGYGPWAAMGTSLRRLRLHSLDALNAEPLFLAVLAAAVWAWRRGVARGVVLYPLAVVLAYAPFYFDGNYPGGGARLLTDAVPVEQAMVAVWLVHVATRPRTLQVFGALVVVAGLRVVPLHLALRDREGGVPMGQALQADVRNVLLTNTDHGYLQAAGTGDAPLVARLRGDANDRMLAESLGLPLFTARFDTATGQTERLAWQPPDTPWLRFEAEHEWPVRSLIGGSALPSHLQPGCASQGRVLELHSDAAEARVELTFWLSRPLRAALDLELVGRDHAVELTVELDERPVGAARSEPGACSRNSLGEHQLAAGPHTVHLRWPARASLAVDALLLTPSPASDPVGPMLP